ncbi:HEAT and Phosphatidylinositol 3-4-kinase and PIK-related kinase domain containing protein [Aphelenchoides besseyi]|nr:HEAT and Phosphatidylinositol 3-4-kinase and PIK-related kinase domain containing protein [Aphelenchoides besseyi]
MLMKDTQKEDNQKLLEKGIELIQIWETSRTRLPVAFQDKVVEELKNGLIEPQKSYYGFGLLAHIALQILHLHLNSIEIVELTRKCFQKTKCDSLSYTHLLSYVATVMESENNSLRSTITSLILDSDSVVDYYRPNRGLAEAQLIRIFIRLLSSQDISHIQRYYPVIVRSIKEHMNDLKTMVENGTCARSTATTIEKIITLHLSAVYPLTILKNSFMIMALSPNLIDLFYSHMCLGELWFYKQFPVLHMNTLAVALSFAKTHDFFILTSSWIQKTNKFVISPSASFLQEQITVLSKLLTKVQELTLSTADLCIEWLFLLVQSLGTNVEIVRDKIEFIELRKAILFVNFEGRTVTQTRIDNVVDNLRVYDVLATECTNSECVQFLMKMLQCPRFRSLDSWNQIWKRLPPDFFTRIFLQIPPFEINDYHVQDRKLTLETLLFHESKEIDGINQQLVDVLLTKYLETRQVDFAEMGRKIAEQVRRLQNGHLEVSSRDFNNGRQMRRFVRSDVELNWLRVSGLLSLVQRLHRLKLKTNRNGKTLTERHNTVESILDWSRDELLTAFEMAYKSGHYEFIVYASTPYLTSFDQSHKDQLIPLICWMTRALVQLKNADAIKGLRIWASAHFDGVFNWLEQAERLANGHFETAIINLDNICGSVYDRNIITETVYHLREIGIRHCEPTISRQLAPRFFTQFMQPIGAPPKYVTELLNPDIVLSLTSWGTYDSANSLPPELHHVPGHNLHRSFDRIEMNLSSLHKIFATFGMASTPDVLPQLDELERNLSNLCQLDPVFTLNSLIASKIFAQLTTISILRDFIFNTSSVNLELLSSSLNYTTKQTLTSRLEIAQKLSTWTTRIFGPQNQIAKSCSTILARLSRKTGNFLSANQQTLSNGNMLHGLLNNGYGDLKSLSEALKLEYCRNGKDVESKFIALADHLNSITHSATSTPSELAKSCLLLSKYSQVITLNSDVILKKGEQKHFYFWPKIVDTLNYYHSLSPGGQFNRLLSGSFISVAADHPNLEPKIHWKMGIWAMEQISTDTTVGVDAIRLLPSESVAIQALCGSLSQPLLEKFLLTFGQRDELNELRSSLQDSADFADKTSLISGIKTDAFEELWGQIKKRQRTFFDLASNSFIKFLSEDVETILNHAVVVSLNLIQLLTSHPTLFSNLDCASTWIDGTKSTVWLELLPQLFALLKHHDSYVRDVCRRLILHCANDFPHIICWPAVVHSKASRAEPTMFADNESQFTSINECADVMSFGLPAYKPNKQNVEIASGICAEIVEELRQSKPEMIAGVISFIHHFRSVVMLTMERWLYVLTNLEYEIAKRQKQLEMERSQFLEILKTEEKVEELMAKRTEGIYLNALEMVKDLYKTTCEGDFETVEQQKFARQFKDLICRSMRKAETKFRKPDPSFEVFKKLTERLSGAIRRQQRLKLSNLSSMLATSDWSVVPIPGQNSKSDEVVTINNIKESIFMLATKTRPKKLTMIGSDGKSHAFLCKGQEDLHLDERISNVLRACNYFFASSKEMRDNNRIAYHARSYSVTPLGSRSGLIQWVDGPVSLYNIYRSWRTTKLAQYRTAMESRKTERNATKFRLLKRSVTVEVNSEEEENGVVAGQSLDEDDERELELLHRDDRASQRSAERAIEFSQNSRELDLSAAMGDLIPRVISPPKQEDDTLLKEYKRLRMSPIDLFTSLLRTKFKEKNITTEVMRNRKQWPTDLLVEVFTELQTTAPKTLVADEFCLKSKSSTEWWRRISTFARSTAVMSMIGFVLGLGDRHLDNVLVDLTNGEIVHVDYNVIFQKSAQLRVPECVPFRLTENIVSALGPTKIEGTFRASSERTLSVLSQSSFAISNLLGAFVYDPLVEWMKFGFETTNIGLSLMIYDEDRRLKLAAVNALQILRTYLETFEPKMKEIREELKSALDQICQLFAEMNSHRADHGVQSELGHFDVRRVESGQKLYDSIVEHQNLMRILKPLLRILSLVDQRFYVFTKIYRSTFSEPLVKGHRLLNESYIDYVRCIEYFRTALDNIESVYTQLTELRSIDELLDFEEIDATPLTPDVTSLAGSFYDLSASTVIKDPTNQIGVEIVESVKRKLAGLPTSMNSNSRTSKDDDEQSMSVAENVDQLIRTATDVRNLSRMYEGFTGWV